MRAKRVRPAPTSTQTIIMKGGYNEEVSTLEQRGGELIFGYNYYLVEGSSGGYRSTKGYERYDGQTLASDIGLNPGAENPEADREAQRDLIGEVPGEGNVLGIHIYKDKLYAFRDNVGSTETDMYVESPSGWTKVDLGSRITFDTGATATLEVGEVITGGASSATANVRRVVVTSGKWEDGDAAGHLIIDVLTGTFQSGETVTGGTSGGTASTTSLAVSQSISVDGKYHFINNNFFAGSSTEYMYFTNGVNQAMVWDGTAFDFIDNSGMGSNDKPITLIAHNDRLFLTYAGGSLQYSTLGRPEDWTTDPGEIGVGKEITALTEAVGNALVIFCVEGIRVLQGTADSDTWQLDEFSQTTGAYEFTPFRLFGTIMFMDNQGVSTLDAVQEFGDFKASSISQKVYKTLQDNKSRVTTSTIHRQLNQYRLFFSNGLGVVFSFKGTNFMGATLLDFPNPVLISCVGRDSSDESVVFFASSGSGYVYKMESGTSFDGADISTRLQTAYYNYNSPIDWKRFVSMTLEISCVDSVEVFYKNLFDYRETVVPQGVNKTFDVSVDNDVWGDKNWGVMTWSTNNVTNRVRGYIQGLGTNMAVSLKALSRTSAQHTIQNMTVVFEKTKRQL
jgi:hypothetical protein